MKLCHCSWSYWFFATLAQRPGRGFLERLGKWTSRKDISDHVQMELRLNWTKGRPSGGLRRRIASQGGSNATGLPLLAPPGLSGMSRPFSPSKPRPQPVPINLLETPTCLLILPFQSQVAMIRGTFSMLWKISFIILKLTVKPLTPKCGNMK